MSSIKDIIHPYFSHHDITSLWVTNDRVKALHNWTNNVHRQGVYHAASVAFALAGNIHNSLVEGDIKVVEIRWSTPQEFGQQHQYVTVRMDTGTDIFCSP
jgi:hypothetical protein